MNPVTLATDWISPEVLRTLGLALLHFVWQGAAIALFAAAALATLRGAPTRYAMSLVALVMMIAAPVATFFVLRAETPAAGSWQVAAAPALAGAAKVLTHRAANALGADGPHLSTQLITLFTELWFAGVLIFSLRTAGGFLVVARLRRRESQAVSGELLAVCQAMQRRLGITRVVRYCESLRLDAPAVVGWLRPVMLLPVSAITGLNELQLRAVIAHELAHIRRFDAFFNLFQVAAETLLFYHPAVWWLNKRIRAERENCCDDMALAVCGSPAEYARALALMETWRSAPSLAMAANRGPLATRVARLLGFSAQPSGTLRSAGLALGAICLAATLFAGNALFGFVRTASARPALIPQLKVELSRLADHLKPALSPSVRPPIRLTAKSRTNVAPSLRLNAATMNSVSSSAVTDTIEFNSFNYSFNPQSSAIVITAPRPEPEPQAKPAQAQGAGGAAGKASYVEAMKAEGFDNLDADELIAMKVQGITPEYIHAIRAEGFKPSADELITLKVQGVTPEYIRQVRAMNIGANDVDTIVAMKIQGVTPEYVQEMKQLGFHSDAEELIAMKIQGVNAAYVKQLTEMGIKADGEDVIALKIQGVTPEYVKSIRATGLNPDSEEWISLKVQGVTADYVKALQDAGFKPSVEEVVGAKVMGVTPKFIADAKSHGFKNLTLEKLIGLKNAGVLD